MLREAYGCFPEPLPHAFVARRPVLNAALTLGLLAGLEVVRFATVDATVDGQPATVPWPLQDFQSRRIGFR